MSFDRKLLILFVVSLLFASRAAIAADTTKEISPDPIAASDISRSSAP